MASVTGMTVAKIEETLDQMVVSVRVDSGQLVYEKRNGEEVNGGDLVDADFAVGASWPINSIYISVVPTNPADMLGIGTWTRFGQGRMLVSQDGTQPEFDVAQETGGEKTHQLTIAEMPAHTHVGGLHSHVTPNHSHSFTVSWRKEVTLNSSGSALTRVGGGGDGDIDQSNTGNTNSGGSGATTSDGAVNTSSRGGDGAHNNLPPYIVVYMWKRTA